MADENGNGNGNNVGTVEQVTGVVVDVALPRRAARDLLGARRSRSPEGDGRDGDATSSARSSSTSATTACARSRWTPPTACSRGDKVVDTGGPITVPGRQGDARPDLQPARRADRRGRATVEGDDRWPIHRPAPEVEDLTPDPGDPRDRDQGRRPARPLRQGRQGRPVRRRRRRQDRADPGADPQHRRGARGPLGLLRRRRALARGQRPLARDEGVGRHRQDDARLRPDERAARARAFASPCPA